MSNFDFLYSLRGYTLADVSEDIYNKLSRASLSIARKYTDIVDGVWLISKGVPIALLVSNSVPQSDTRVLQLDSELNKIFNDDDGESFFLFDLQKDVIERGEIKAEDLTDALSVYLNPKLQK